MYPEACPTDQCKLCCRETSDQNHILWDCVMKPEEAASRTIPPRLKEAARSYTYEHQLWVTQPSIGIRIGIRISIRIGIRIGEPRIGIRLQFT